MGRFYNRSNSDIGKKWDKKIRKRKLGKKLVLKPFIYVDHFDHPHSSVNIHLKKNIPFYFKMNAFYIENSLLSVVSKNWFLGYFRSNRTFSEFIRLFQLFWIFLKLLTLHACIKLNADSKFLVHFVKRPHLWSKWSTYRYPYSPVSQG